MASLARIFARYDLTLAEINPLGKMEDGSFIAVDGHVDLEAEARGRHRELLQELGIGEEETRQARPPTDFELNGRAINDADHRGVERDVLVQIYERRVLTYTPANPPEWQVEMGNVGRHYYLWRHGR